MKRKTHIDELFPDVRAVVGVRVVSVHVLDGVEDAIGVEGVVVLPDVVLHHHVEELPADVVGGGQALVVVWKELNRMNIDFFILRY